MINRRSIYGQLRHQVLALGLLSVVCLCLLPSSNSHAATYILYGNMTDVTYLGDKTISQTCQFTVMTSDQNCAFMIENVDTTGPEDKDTIQQLQQSIARDLSPPWSRGPNAPGIRRAAHVPKQQSDIHIWSFDGSNNFTLHGTGDLCGGIVKPGFALEASDTVQEVLWLAFVPRCNVLSLTNSLMTPIWPSGSPKSLTPPYKLPVRFKTFAGPVGFLEVLAYVNEGVYRRFDTNGSMVVEPLVGRYAKGYTNALYQVTKITNTPVGIFPLECAFTRYADIPPDYEGSMQMLTRSEIQVTNILETNGVADFRPAFGHRSAQVYDYRVAGSVKIAGTVEVPYDCVRYSISNGAWPSSNELAGTRELMETQIRSQYAATAKAIPQAVENKKRSVVTGIVLWSVIGISFGIIVISIIRSLKQNAIK